MALLNIAKFKKDGGEKSAEEGKASDNVPEELPDIPSGEAKPAEGGEAKPAEGGEAKPAEGGEAKSAEADSSQEQSHSEGNQDTLNMIKKDTNAMKEDINKLQSVSDGTSGLAPNELPPLEDNEPEVATTEVKSSAEAPIKTQAQPAQKSVAPNDSKLFFSDLIARFHDKNMQKEVEKAIISSASGEIISHLTSQWNDKKVDEDLEEIDRKIVSNMKPLQVLEQEWRALKSEINLKTNQLNEKEIEIKNATIALRDLLKEKHKFKEHHMKRKEHKAHIESHS